MSDEKTEAGVSFAELDLAPDVLHAVRDAGYTHPTPIQQQAIPLALAGRDLIGLAQTGTGKTAGFTLPIVHNLITTPLVGDDGQPLHRVRVLILTPTRELAAQVEESFRKYGKHTELRVVPVYGGVGLEPQSKALRRGVDVVVATPGRLLDHMERGNVSFDDLEVLVLDEADRMLDMGFAPQLNRIVNDIPRYRQTLLFSATMPPEVEALARKYLRKPVVVQVGRRSEAASTVTHAVYPVPRDRKNTLLVELLKKPEMDSVLVFTRTKHGADRVVRHLEDQGIAATAMHADKSQGERRRRLHLHVAGRDLDGARHRADHRPADPAHLRPGLRLRHHRRVGGARSYRVAPCRRGGARNQWRTRPSRETKTVSTTDLRRTTTLRFAAPYPIPVAA